MDAFYGQIEVMGLYFVLELVAKVTAVIGFTAIVSLVFRRYASIPKLFWTWTITIVFLLPLLTLALPQIPVPTLLFNSMAMESVPEGNTLATSSLISGSPIPTEATPVIENTKFYLFTLWLLVGVGLLIKLIVKTHRTQSLRKSMMREYSKLSDSALLEFFSGAAFRKVRERVFVSKGVNSPMVLGIVNQSIFLPIEFLEWSKEKRRCTLLHEFAHMDTRDNLYRFIARLACCLYWFHPLIWLANNRLIEEQEKTADDYVITHDVLPSSYASCLMEIVASQRVGMALSPEGAGISSSKFFSKRMKLILGSGRRRNALNHRKLKLLSFALFCTVFPLAAATTSSVSAEKEDMVAVFSGTPATSTGEWLELIPVDFTITTDGEFPVTQWSANMLVRVDNLENYQIDGLLVALAEQGLRYSAASFPDQQFGDTRYIQIELPTPGTEQFDYIKTKMEELQFPDQHLSLTLRDGEN